MNFCNGCNNMYYLKINEGGEDTKDQLIFYCRNCGNEETNLSAENICVSSFENVDKNDNHETHINEFTKLDPTLPRINNIKCPNSNCGTNSANDPTTREIIYVRYNNIDMKYVYMCSTCNSIWKTSINN